MHLGRSQERWVRKDGMLQLWLSLALPRLYQTDFLALPRLHQTGFAEIPALMSSHANHLFVRSVSILLVFD